MQHPLVEVANDCLVEREDGTFTANPQGLRHLERELMALADSGELVPAVRDLMLWVVFANTRLQSPEAATAVQDLLFDVKSRLPKETDFPSLEMNTEHWSQLAGQAKRDDG